jgi:hypothetical protein
VRCFSFQASIFNLLPDVHTECDESSITAGPDLDAFESETSKKSAVPSDERREVLRLVAAALEDPHCNSAALSTTADVLELLYEGVPLSLKDYHATVAQYAPHAILVPMDRGHQDYRGQFLMSLMTKQFLDHQKMATGKRVATVEL